MAGRSSKLTEELTDIICKNIELGLSYRLTCQAAGIAFQTFNEWMKAGEAGKEEKFTIFYNRVQASEAECARQSLERIKDAAKHTWQASAWLLERRYPADYGRKDHINMKSKSQNESVICNVNSGTAEADSLRSEIMRRLSGEPGPEQ